MNTFYISATNQMSWGRGTREWEAIGHALENCGKKPERIVLFEVICPEGSLESEVYVNEMGNIIAPKGSEVKELSMSKLELSIDTFYSFYDSLK